MSGRNLQGGTSVREGLKKVLVMGRSGGVEFLIVLMAC